MNVEELFPTPVELLAFYEPAIREGSFEVYPWQIKAMDSFARELTSEEIGKTAVCAANGSGKSQFCLAPCAVWHAVRFQQSQTVVTSASGTQLDKQAGRQIKRLAREMNRVHKNEFGGEEPWVINYRRLHYRPNDSYIDLFATDDEGHAEGWHPLRPGGSFAIVVDEGKNIAEEIYKALDRCNGCTRRLDVSSPGDCIGHFYNVMTNEGLGWEIIRATAWDCPHIKKSEIDYLIKLHGPHDPFIRSSLFAEFVSVDSLTVLTLETIRECRRLCFETMDLPRRAGVDLSAGRDEVVFSLWEGNRQLAQDTFRMKDTTNTAKEIVNFIQRYHVKAENVYADDGGVGRGIIDHIHLLGYPIVRVLNQAKPFDKTRYANRGTEIWFNFKRYVEEHKLLMVDDDALLSQLANRYYKRQPTTQKLILESKPEAKARGHPSPDRADAAVLAWCAYSFMEFAETEMQKSRKVTPEGILSPEEFKKLDDRRLRELTKTFATRESPTWNGFQQELYPSKPITRQKKFPFFDQRTSFRRN